MPGTPALPWQQWKRLLENFLRASGGSEFAPSRQQAILLHSLGAEGQRIFYYLPGVKASSTVQKKKREAAQSNESEDAIARLDGYFISPVNVVLERHLASTCDLDAQIDERVRDQMVAGVAPLYLRESFL